MIERASWAEYFMGIAQAVSTRGTCDRKRVGCVLVADRRILASGYNGSVPGAEHCDAVGHDLVESIGPDGVARPNCIRTVHAEANAVAQAARFGTPLLGATAYVNTFPCWGCAKLMKSAGVAIVVYADEYRNDARVVAVYPGGTLQRYSPAPKAPPAPAHTND